MKRFLRVLILFLYIIGPLFPLGSQTPRQPVTEKYKVVEGKTKWNPDRYIPLDWYKEMCPGQPEAIVYLYYYGNYGGNKYGRVYFMCHKENFDFNDMYSTTMHVLEEFCIMMNFRRPVLRRDPQLRESRTYSGVEWVTYEAYLDFKEK